MSERCVLNKNKSNIEWSITPKELHEKFCKKNKKTIFDALFDTVEFAGKFYLIYNSSCNSKNKNCKVAEIVFEKMNRGSTSSVKAEHGICNFHTHPLYCYEGMEKKDPRDQTIWGWPSGEDMRESICFALKGNLIHLIFTMEGTYSIQVNPKYIEILKSKLFNEDERGAFISMVENYFKTTHGYRNCVFNKNLGKNVCQPMDWVQFARNFTVNNFDSSHINKCSKRLPCNGWPDTQEIKPIDIHEYRKSFGLEKYQCSKKGSIYDNGEELSKIETNKILKKVKSCFDIEHTDRNDKFWNKGQWFHVQLSPNLYKGNCILREIQGKTYNQIYDMWQEVKHNRNLLKFGNVDVIFHTKTPINKKSCYIE